jgi:hypothetical protein
MTGFARTEAVRGGWGALLLLQPRLVLRLVHGAPVDGPGVPVLRVLGTRHLLQACAVTLRPTRGVLLLAAAADLSHCLSALPLAAVGTAYRRAGVVETVLAGALAGLEARRRRTSRSRHHARVGR